MQKIFKKIWEYRELLYILTKKNLKVRYKEAILGVAWAVFVPLATMAIFAFVFSRFARFNTGNIPYPVFLFCGILPWTFLSTSLNAAVETLVSNSALITKANFPKEVLPLSIILSNLADFLIGLAVFFLLIIAYKVHLSLNILWLIPILSLQIIFLTGASLLLSVANLYYRDVKYIFQVLLTLWFFLSPVFYPINLLMKHRWLIWINPMTPIITLYRFALVNTAIPPVDIILAGFFLSFLVFFVGFWNFDRIEKNFPRYL